ncbi:MAG TPA: hypothetical protein VFC04_03840 [Actinomycetota bacterium]|nr:hypothetical protein [Actinomycetota bacterium]
MDAREAALTVLWEERKPLHWTVIQNLALRRGYLDPFAEPNVRRRLLAALAEAARMGLIVREGTGVYRLP